MSAPAWKKIHDHVLAKIRAGRWVEGDRVPSEAELCERFGVARMTVGRALRELVAAQVVVRVKGAGTFVAPPRHHATVVEIRSIADEIAASGRRHETEVLLLEKSAADAALAVLMGVKRGARLFHSRLLHRDDGVPRQLEERWVNPALAPDFLAQDFTRTTPNEYLTRAAPLEQVEYGIEARQPDAETRRRLAMGRDEPCLLLRRRTWSRGRVASAARLWHPGNRHQFTGRF
ncbi:MAG: histidine utilization repressor [Betaproteobacteria bacterium]|nr:histidine utilization repressor [Betaproteobacteria bacterium]